MKGNSFLTTAILTIFVALNIIWRPTLGQFEQPITPEEQYSLIAFASNREGNMDIYILSPDGSDIVNLTKNSRYDIAPRWLPSIGTITFSAVRDEHERQVFPYIMDIDGSNIQLYEAMTFLLENGFVDVSQIYPSPDDKKIAFVSEKTGNNEIYIMEQNGLEPINITNNQSIDESPAWSPDNTRIAFVSDRNGNSEIYALDIMNDGEPINLTEHDSADFTPVWSPNGQQIAFGTNRDGNTEVYVMNVDGSGASNLTNNLAGDWNPSWSPDGRLIVFDTDRDGNREIYIMDASGNNFVNLTKHPSEDVFPAWSPFLVVEAEQLNDS